MSKKLKFWVWIFSICVISFLISVISVYAQETLTITTYYPSPYGSYNELTVAQNLKLETSPTTPAADGPQIEWRTSNITTDWHWNIDQIQGLGEQPRLRFFTERNDGLVSGEEKISILENGKVTIQAKGDVADSLLVHSTNYQGSIGISGKSDNDLTYSALYFHDETPDNDNNWVIGHRKMLGTAEANAFHIARWPTAAPATSFTAMAIKTNGNVGIGTATPDWLLHVNGSAAKPGGGSWTDSSDIRLKKNIRPIEGALEKMLQLRGVSFEWDEPGRAKLLPGTQLGMVGQDAEKVFPQWVNTNEDGYKDLTFRGFEALTVEAIRDLKAENEALKERIKALEVKLNL